MTVTPPWNPSSYPTDSYTADLREFIESSPSAWHCAEAVRARFVDAGFREVSAAEPWPEAPGGYVMVRDGAVMAWWRPQRLRDDPEFRVVGVHTDSPTFALKPKPSSTHASGWGQLNVEVYGGMIPDTWVDRDLALAGRLIGTDGRATLVRTDAIARIPHLAIHLDRSQRESLHLDPQQHLRPIWTIGAEADVLDYLAHQVGWGGAQDVTAFDVVMIDSQPPALLGADHNLLAAPRQDNLVSVFSAMRALLAAAGSDAAEEAGRLLVFAAFSHEEVGSETMTGAAGPILEDVLERLAEPLDPTRSAWRRMIARSLCLSADVAHSVHPNYADRHDPEHWPIAGGGPVLKINANQRYATEAIGAACWRRCCELADVPHQDFVSNNAVTCGSTIAPITATRLGIRTIDVGSPILSMHSARELSHVADHPAMSQAMAAFWAS
ncbi:MAG: M18 family aminopeptidase [Actinomycetaceae bacterium]|nr:M18 family aminopeptidase [Actinomycetaceae bacterium]MDU0969833.1 M18 family aminopeptidase [Actinomycetaceae bacterium]